MGYMLAIVITLGSYFAGLHWLIRPPDPWQPHAKIAANTAQQIVARKRSPVVKPAEAARSEPAAAKEPDTRMASVEMPASAAFTESAPARPSEPGVVQARRPAQATAPVDAPQPAPAPAHIMRRDALPTKTKPGSRKRVEANTGRKLQLMVLRTYERSDGKRFTRLLPLNSVRSAMAFYPNDLW
jgi:hypothetical protein